jgi:hypothetical protein
MNFQQFVHEVTDVILTLDKDKIYAESILKVGRSVCEYFDNKIKEFKIDMWSYDWDLEKDFNKMKIKFNWKTLEKDYPYHYIHSYKNDNGAKRIVFATKMNLSSEEYEYDLKMIKEMINYLNKGRLTKYE